MALFELDRAYYQNAKREIVRRSQYDIFPALNDYLSDNPALRYFEADSEDSREQAQRALKDRFNQIASQDWSIFRARLLDRDYGVLIEAPSPEEQKRKIREYNSARNCLLLRNFEGSVRQFVQKPVENAKQIVPLGWIEVSFTSPKGMPEIELLTQRYRIYAVQLTIFISLIFYGLFRVTIRPLRRVSGAIESSILRQPVLLRRPATSLERGYNELARDALLASLQGEIRDLIGGRSPLDPSDLFRHLAGVIGRLFNVPFVSIREVREEEGGDPKTLRVHIHQAAASPEPDPEALERFETRRAMLPREEKEGEIPGSPLRFVTRVIRRGQESGEFAALTLGYDPNAVGAHYGWPAETASRLAEEAGKAIESLRLHQANVFRQRSEGSINLAENLGHDLTNIIATAKLDLITLKQILQDGLGQLTDSPRLAQILKESIEHLLANTRFLQEIVSIYRAFTNLKRPVYERVDLNKVADEISQLFVSSSSGRIRLERQFDDGLPLCHAEPRLIKLALFNLLTNASDAIKAGQSGGEGRIAIRTRCDAQRREAMLAVRDNGPGIRNEEGALAGPDEISRIFRLGISSKKENPGAGLGLSWVGSIVLEFHAGRLEASNNDEGGAEFRIYLPLESPLGDNSMESFEGGDPKRSAQSPSVRPTPAPR